MVGGSPQFEALVYRGSDLASLGAPEIYFGLRTEANQHKKKTCYSNVIDRRPPIVHPIRSAQTQEFLWKHFVSFECSLHSRVLFALPCARCTPVCSLHSRVLVALPCARCLSCAPSAARGVALPPRRCLPMLTARPKIRLVIS